MSVHSHGLVCVQQILLVVLVSLSICGLMIFAVCVGEVNAQVRVLASSQHDLDGDGQPDLLTVECAFATQHDRLYVYDGDKDMKWDRRGISAADFDNDVWIFDVGSDGSAQLIIQFAEENEKAVAYLYDDVDGDGVVKFKVKGKEVQVLESSYWHVKVSSTGARWIEAGLVEPNLSIWIDGYVHRYLTWGEMLPGLDWALENVSTDGQVDWFIEIVDQDGDAFADYQLQLVLAGFPQEIPVFRSTLYVDKSNRRPTLYPDAVFWPLLVGRHNYEGYNYFDHPAAISMNWQQGKIDRVGILGYPAENGYHINSRSGAWLKWQINYADFENPMAYYDLAADRDGLAELFVRFEVFAAHDPFFLESQFPYPLAEVEYAWDGDNDGDWDYQLNLGGTQPITSTVAFRDFSIQTVPYQQVPDWVIDRSWQAALFVSAENGGHRNSEGMSIWNLNRGFCAGRLVEPSGLRNEYMTGLRDDAPLEDYSEIGEGFRGELAFEYFRKPMLYLSSLDKKLHLKNASSGVWHLEAEGEIRYANLNADAYLDHWEYWLDGALQQTLTQVENYLIFSGNGQVVIKEFDKPLSLFEAPPPRNHSEWTQLNGLLTAHYPDFSPVNLRAMQAKIPGQEIIIMAAKSGIVQITEHGFGFILILEPDHQVEGADILNLGSLPVGEYFVKYQDGFQVSPLKPADLQIVPAYKKLLSDPLKVSNRLDLVFRLVNTGVEEAHEAVLSARFQSAGEDLASTWESGVLRAIPGGESIDLWVPWRPQVSGEWEILVAANWLGADPGESGSTHIMEKIFVEQTGAATFGEILGLFGSVWPSTVCVLMFCVLVSAGIAGLAIFLRMPTAVIILLPLVVLMSLYWIGRDGGYAMEVDASRITRSAGGIIKASSLIHRQAYPAGYTYPVLLAFTNHLTGLRVQDLQLMASLWVPVLVMTAFICYRELVGSRLKAALGCFLLFVQPDFTFYVMRSSHEKITWCLTLLLWFLMARIYRSINRPAQRSVYAFLYCVVFWGLATTNVFFASIILLGFIFYILASWAICWLHPGSKQVEGKSRLLGYSLSLWVIGCLMILNLIHFVYPPAANYGQVLNLLQERLWLLFTGGDLRQPYAYVTSAWINPWVYAILTGPQWVIVLIGLIAWWHGQKRLLEMNQVVWMLWLLYAAFGLLLMFAVIADLAGFLSLNLQVRLFPAFALANAPVAAHAIVVAMGKRRVQGRGAPLLAALLAGYAAVAAMLKTTNEPALSNQWLFYSPAELQAMRWTDEHLKGQRVWSDISSHQVDVLGFWEGYGAGRANEFQFGEPDRPAENVLDSRLTRLQAARYGKGLPGTLGYNRVYDNGMAQLYRRPPRTPYQR